MFRLLCFAAGAFGATSIALCLLQQDIRRQAELRRQAAWQPRFRLPVPPKPEPQPLTRQQLLIRTALSDNPFSDS